MSREIWTWEGMLKLSPGEEHNGGRENSSLLSDVCEAIIAALYQDGGLEVARAFVEKHWAPLIEENSPPPKDAKTALQEWAQGEGMPCPSIQKRAGMDRIIAQFSPWKWPSKV